MLLCHVLGGFEHRFRKDGIAFGGVIDKHVRDSTDKLTILHKRAATHECVKQDTTTIFEVFLAAFYLKILILTLKYAQFNFFKCISPFYCKIGEPLYALFLRFLVKTPGVRFYKNSNYFATIFTQNPPIRVESAVTLY